MASVEPGAGRYMHLRSSLALPTGECGGTNGSLDGDPAGRPRGRPRYLRSLIRAGGVVSAGGAPLRVLIAAIIPVIMRMV